MQILLDKLFLLMVKYIYHPGMAQLNLQDRENRTMAKVVQAYQDTFGMSQEAFGAIDGIRVSWSMSDTGEVNADLIVGDKATSFTVPFEILCKAARPFIRGIIRANKTVLGNAVRKATPGRGSTKPILVAVEVKKAV